MDAAEQLRLQDGSPFCWLRLADECSGAILATEVFAHARWAQVPDTQAQQAIRGCFQRWGCPQAMRVDNGIPWGTSSGLPSELSLWLAGLGVAMHWNDPYCPEQNGVAESTQRVSQRWVWPSGCAELPEVRRKLQREDWVQRALYPVVAGLSRRQAYPALLHSGRGYSRGWEEAVWDPGQALRFLGRYRVRRKVSCRGQVSVYHRLIEVGRERAGAWVYVGMDAEAVEWVIWEVDGKEVRRRPAPQFTAEALSHLAVARR
jgi:hypothetical protein